MEFPTVDYDGCEFGFLVDWDDKEANNANARNRRSHKNIRSDRHYLRKLLKAQDEADKLEIFHQVLLSKGLVKEVKNPSVTDAIERQLIEVKGKPVSQTNIEERK